MLRTILTYGASLAAGAIGLDEMRIHTGPGYRVYFTRQGKVVYILLPGGDKSTQRRDIRRAIQMARLLRN